MVLQRTTERIISLLKSISRRSFLSIHIRLAEGGFGCSPNASGRVVYATCLGDGEHTRWDRSDFVGVIREECMPEWAKESLAHLRPQQQTDAPTMNGMTMK